jgi:hypothetical protein
MAIPRDLGLATAGERSTPRIDPSLKDVIRRASRATGVDFGYLMAEAGQESGFRSDAKASTSSAEGLFQFTEGTWLDMMRRHGAQYGQGVLAAQIGSDAAGRPSVADPAQRKAILDLRRDPALSAAFAAEYARSNKGEVEKALGRSAGATDLYLAHFLGPTGAGNFLKATRGDGAAEAAALFPDAAAANRAIFYDGGGRARSVAEVHRIFTDKIDGAARSFAAGEAAAGGTAAGGVATAAVSVRPVGSPVQLPGLRLALADVLTLSAVRLVADGHRSADEKRRGPSTL